MTLRSARRRGRLRWPQPTARVHRPERSEVEKEIYKLVEANKGEEEEAGRLDDKLSLYYAVYIMLWTAPGDHFAL